MSEERRPVAVSPTDGTSWRLARAWGGALQRLLRALPDYVAGQRPTGTGSSVHRSGRPETDDDTGEWPAPSGPDPDGG